MINLHQLSLYLLENIIRTKVWKKQYFHEPLLIRPKNKSHSLRRHMTPGYQTTNIHNTKAFTALMKLKKSSFSATESQGWVCKFQILKSSRLWVPKHWNCIPEQYLTWCFDHFRLTVNIPVAKQLPDLWLLLLFSKCLFNLVNSSCGACDSQHRVSNDCREV